MKRNHEHSMARTAMALVLVTATAGLSGCASINPFDRSSTEPLPPVQGNVIATATNRPAAERIDTGTAVSAPDAGGSAAAQSATAAASEAQPQ